MPPEYCSLCVGKGVCDMHRYWTTVVCGAAFVLSAPAIAAKLDHASIRAACAAEIGIAARENGWTDATEIAASLDAMIDELNQLLKSELRQDIKEMPVHQDTRIDLLICLANKVLIARAAEPESSGRSHRELVRGTDGGSDDAADAAAAAADAGAAGGGSDDPAIEAAALEASGMTGSADAQAAEEAPLGLRESDTSELSKPPPARAERYWLQGLYTEDFDCGIFCPPGRGVRVIITTNDPIGSRQSGAGSPRTFGFGPPMEAGTKWEIAIDPAFSNENYTCSVKRGIGGIVLPDADSINEGFAQEVSEIVCVLTSAGMQKVATAKVEKAASDELLAN